MKGIFTKLQLPIIAFLFLCATAAGLAWLWFTVESSGAELKTRLQTVANQQEFENQLTQLTGEVKGSAIEREQLKSFILSDEKDTIALLSELDRIAQNQGVQLATQELQVKEKKGRFNTLSMRLKISGTEANVLRLIRMLEVLPYHGEMSSLSFDRRHDDTTGVSVAEAIITLELTISQYD